MFGFKRFKSIYNGVGLRIRLKCSEDEDEDMSLAVEKYITAMAVSGYKYQKAKFELQVNGVAVLYLSGLNFHSICEGSGKYNQDYKMHLLVHL